MDELLPRLWIRDRSRWNWRRKFIIAVVFVVVITIGIVFSSVKSGAVSTDGTQLASLYDKSIRVPEQDDRLVERIDEKGTGKMVPSDSLIIQAINIKNSKYQKYSSSRTELVRKFEKEIASLDFIENVKVIVELEDDNLFMDSNISKVEIIVALKENIDLSQDNIKATEIRDIVKLFDSTIENEKIIIDSRSELEFDEIVKIDNKNVVRLRGSHEAVKNRLQAYYSKKILDSLGEIFPADRVKVLNLHVSLENHLISGNQNNIPPLKLAVTNGERYSENIDELTVISNVDRTDGNSTFQRIVGINEQSYNPSFEFGNDTGNIFDRFGEASLWSVKYVSGNIVIDGVWHTLFEPNGQVRMDENGAIERQYLAVEPDNMKIAERLIKENIDTVENQGSSVTVKHLQFDRSRQFSEEDELMRREIDLLRMFPLVTAGVVALIVTAGFLFRRRWLYVSHTVDNKMTRSNGW